MSHKKRTLGGEVTKLGVRLVESLIVVAVIGGVRVIDYFLANPWKAPEIIWEEVARAGNILLVFIVLILLYLTDIDKKILDWLMGK